MNFRRKRGFTLIELLVVVAIIALLISILLPSLREAREQGRVAKCIANLKGLMLAVNMYKTNNTGRLDLQWQVKDGRDTGGVSFGTVSYITEFVWGGGMPDKTSSDWSNSGLDVANGGTASQFIHMDTYTIPPRFRAMNKYVTGEVTWDKEPGPDRTRIPADIPDYFQCPSDRTAIVPTVEQDNGSFETDSPFRCWEWWGSSYPINWYWPYYYKTVLKGKYSEFLNVIGYDLSDDGTRGLGTELLKEKDGRYAAEFVLLYEGQCNYSFEGARPPNNGNRGPWKSDRKQRVGWHNKFSKHSIGFLDGHAEYKLVDTRFVYGDNWSIWPNKPWAAPFKASNDYPPTDEWAK